MEKPHKKREIFITETTEEITPTVIQLPVSTFGTFMIGSILRYRNPDNLRVVLSLREEDFDRRHPNGLKFTTQDTDTMEAETLNQDWVMVPSGPVAKLVKRAFSTCEKRGITLDGKKLHVVNGTVNLGTPRKRYATEPNYCDSLFSSGNSYVISEYIYYYYFDLVLVSYSGRIRVHLSPNLNFLIEQFRFKVGDLVDVYLDTSKCKYTSSNSPKPQQVILIVEMAESIQVPHIMFKNPEVIPFGKLNPPQDDKGSPLVNQVTFYSDVIATTVPVETPNCEDLKQRFKKVDLLPENLYGRAILTLGNVNKKSKEPIVLKIIAINNKCLIENNSGFRLTLLCMDDQNVICKVHFENCSIVNAYEVLELDSFVYFDEYKVINRASEFLHLLPGRILANFDLSIPPRKTQKKTEYVCKGVPNSERYLPTWNFKYFKDVSGTEEDELFDVTGIVTGLSLFQRCKTEGKPEFILRHLVELVDRSSDRPIRILLTIDTAEQSIVQQQMIPGDPIVITNVTLNEKGVLQNTDYSIVMLRDTYKKIESLFSTPHSLIQPFLDLFEDCYSYFNEDLKKQADDRSWIGGPCQIYLPVYESLEEYLGTQEPIKLWGQREIQLVMDVKKDLADKVIQHQMYHGFDIIDSMTALEYRNAIFVGKVGVLSFKKKDVSVHEGSSGGLSTTFFSFFMPRKSTPSTVNRNICFFRTLPSQNIEQAVNEYYMEEKAHTEDANEENIYVEDRNKICMCSLLNEEKDQLFAFVMNGKLVEEILRSHHNKETLLFSVDFYRDKHMNWGTMVRMAYRKNENGKYTSIVKEDTYVVTREKTISRALKMMEDLSINQIDESASSQKEDENGQANGSKTDFEINKDENIPEVKDEKLVNEKRKNKKWIKKTFKKHFK